MSRLIAILGTLVLCSQSAFSQGSFELGVEAYRRAEYSEAEAHWRAALVGSHTDADRARVLYDLGNVAWRQGEPLIAVGWYSMALEHAPRNRDLWHNLELARATAELEPEDRGDLSDTLDHLTLSLLPGEAQQLVLCALGLFALMLLGEALRGGHLWRRLSFLSFLLLCLALVPWVRGNWTQAGGDPYLIIRSPSVSLRSEPRLELDAITSLPGGAEVDRIDELPGWVRVSTKDGTRGWVQKEAVFALSLEPSRGERQVTSGV